MITIIPSIASADQLRIGEEIKKAEAAGRLHLDIEDGNFSPGITFGLDLIEQIAAVTDMEMDAHLMVTNPLFYIDPLMDLGVRSIAFHLESTMYPHECFTAIHDRGGLAGLALNYKTNVREVEPYLDTADYILLQTGEAGDPDLSFRDYTWKKLSILREMIDSAPREAASGSSVPLSEAIETGDIPERRRIGLWVDGAVRPGMFERLTASGVTHAVVGRAYFKGDPAALLEAAHPAGE